MTCGSPLPPPPALTKSTSFWKKKPKKPKPVSVTIPLRVEVKNKDEKRERPKWLFRCTSTKARPEHVPDRPQLILTGSVSCRRAVTLDRRWVDDIHKLASTDEDDDDDDDADDDSENEDDEKSGLEYRRAKGKRRIRTKYIPMFGLDDRSQTERYSNSKSIPQSRHSWVSDATSDFDSHGRGSDVWADIDQDITPRAGILIEDIIEKREFHYSAPCPPPRPRKAPRLPKLVIPAVTPPHNGTTKRKPSKTRVKKNTSVEVHKQMRESLKDCTLEAIINRIHHPFWSDDVTKRVLFMCYRGFCTRDELLTAIEKFYEDPLVPSDFEAYKQADRPNAKANAKMIMRIKLLNSMKYWLRTFFDDFEDCDLERIQNWTTRILRTGDESTRKGVDSILRETKLIKNKKRHRVATQIFLCDYPQPLYDPERTPKDIFDVKCEEIARQMCLMDHEIFASIRPSEFLGQSWKKKDSKANAPNITRMINHFNEVACWCQAMILYQRNLRKRTDVLAQLLKICKYLERNENLNSLRAIMTGIEASPIFRLKKTFSSLKPKHARLLKRFRELLKMDKNYKNLRRRMNSLVEPGIPHLGLFLSDIVFIDDGNVNSRQEKINFHKYSLINDRIEWCLQFQSYPFHFRRLEKVQEEIRRSCKIIPNDFLYKLSLSIEPRES